MDELKKLLSKDNKEKKERYNFSLSPKIKEEAQKKANENNISLSLVVENLLNYYIEKL